MFWDCRQRARRQKVRPGWTDCLRALAGFAAPPPLEPRNYETSRRDAWLNTRLRLPQHHVSRSGRRKDGEDFRADGKHHWSGGVTAPRIARLRRRAGCRCGRCSSCVFQFDLTADSFRPEISPNGSRRIGQASVVRILNSNSNSSSNEPLGLRTACDPGTRQLACRPVRIEEDVGYPGCDASRNRSRQDHIHRSARTTAAGRHQGNWIIDVSSHDVSNHDASTQPALPRHGTLQDISLAQVGALMNDDWISGTAAGISIWMDPEKASVNCWTAPMASYSL